MRPDCTARTTLIPGGSGYISVEVIAAHHTESAIAYKLAPCPTAGAINRIAIVPTRSRALTRRSTERRREQSFLCMEIVE
jgi:hypothetical protein